MSRITIDILGTTAGVPTKERGHAAIHLAYEDGKKTCFMFDCGEGTQRQLRIAGINPMKIDDIFITHWHGDHCLGLPGLVDTMGFEGRTRPLSVYSPEDDRLKKCLDFTHPMGDFEIIQRDVPSSGERMTELLDRERFIISSVPVKHSVPSVAFSLEEKEKDGIDPEKAAKAGLPESGEIYGRLKMGKTVTVGGRQISLPEVSAKTVGKKLVYSGDTEVCDNLKLIARGADLLIQDCTYFEETSEDRPHQHAGLPDILEMVKECGIKKVVLTHISRKYESKDELGKMISGIPDIEIAEDFYRTVI